MGSGCLLWGRRRYLLRVFNPSRLGFSTVVINLKLRCPSQKDMPEESHDPSKMTPDQQLEYLFVTELHFECHWFLRAWEELIGFERNPLLPSNAKSTTEHGNPLKNPIFLRELAMWECVDRLLNHAIKIDRVLSPDRYNSWDRPDSKGMRRVFSNVARKYVHAGDFSAKDLKALRDATEHLNERLYAFATTRDMSSLQPFGWDSEAVIGGPSGSKVVRGFDSYSGICSVLGVAVNLGRVHAWVRSVKFALPELHMGPSRLSLPMGIPEVASEPGQKTSVARMEQGQADTR
jgi:hypothetical protein